LAHSALDLVFLGSGAFGVPTLAALVRAHRVRAIVTQPDRPAGRGGRLTPTPVAVWAAEHAPGVPVLKPPKVNAPEVVAEVRGHGAAAMVVIAFGQKLGRALLADVFAINLHASLLPRWRGAAPINAAVLAGDQETGNSVIALAEVMDAGVVYGQSRRAVYPDQTAGELHDLLADDGPGLVLSVLEQHAAGTLSAREQDATLVTLAPKLSKADGWVDFSEDAEGCRRRVHGLTPWPGVSVRLGALGLKLCRVQVADAEPARAGSEEQTVPGTITDPVLGLVACGRGTVLRVLEVHPAGGRRMSWHDFVNGRTLAAGSVLMGGRPGRTHPNPSFGEGPRHGGDA
jgi:methionyl-tRNA formyltransferase